MKTFLEFLNEVCKQNHLHNFDYCLCEFEKGQISYSEMGFLTEVASHLYAEQIAIKACELHTEGTLKKLSWASALVKQDIRETPTPDIKQLMQE